MATADPSQPSPSTFVTLSPVSGSSHILIEPRRGRGGKATDLALLRHASERLCLPAGKPEQRRVRLRVRLANPSRLGTELQVRADGTHLVAQRLVSTSASLMLPPLTEGCHSITVAGLASDDLLLVPAAVAPYAAILAARSVWELRPGTIQRYDLTVNQPMRVTATVYPERNADLKLRVLVDSARPKRDVSSVAKGFTEPVHERAVVGSSMGTGTARLVDFASIRLAEPARLSYSLRDDLAPGQHTLHVQTAGTGRAFVRITARPQDASEAIP